MKLLALHRTITGFMASALLLGTFCPVLAEEAAPAQSKAPMLLSDYIKSGRGTFQLVGDGQDTHSTDIILKSKSSGATTTAHLYTVCASKKTQKTPQKMETALLDKLEYKIGSAEPEIVCIAKAAEELDRQKQFEGLLLSGEKRRGAITQLAIWKYKGQGDPESEINTATLRADLLKKSHIDEKDIKKKQSKELDNSIADIFACVDLTCKLGLVVAEKQKKKDDRKPDQPVADAPPIALNGGVPAVVPVSAKETPSDADATGGAHNANDANRAGDSQQANNADQPGEAVLIPAYTCFEPNNSKYQNMMTLEDAVIILPRD